MAPRKRGKDPIEDLEARGVFGDTVCLPPEGPEAPVIPRSASPTQLVDLALGWMDAGNTLASFCSISGAPSYSRMRRILASTPEFLERYTGAKRDLADRLWDDAVRIADVVPDVARAKLMIDVRLRLANRLSPEADPKGKSDLVVSVRRFGGEA